MSALEFFRMLSDACEGLGAPFMCRFARPIVRRDVAANDAQRAA